MDAPSRLLGVQVKDPPCDVVVLDPFGRPIDFRQHMTFRQAMQIYGEDRVEVWDRDRRIW